MYVCERNQLLQYFVCINMSMSTENHPPVEIPFLPLLEDFRCKGMKYILLTIIILYTKTRLFRVGNSRVKTAAKAYL